MNTFKTVVMVCAMLAASCSGQYVSHSSGAQGSSGLGGMLGGQYANQGQNTMNTGALPLEQQRPSSSPTFADQSMPSAAPAMSAPSMSAPAMSAPAFSSPSAPSSPATTQQICSCITINPSASASHAASPAVDSSASVAAAPQQSFSAPQQTFAAPVAAAPQQTFAAAPQQTFAAAPQQSFAAAQQQVYAGPQSSAPQSQGRY